MTLMPWHRHPAMPAPPRPLRCYRAKQRYFYKASAFMIGWCAGGRPPACPTFHPHTGHCKGHHLRAWTLSAGVIWDAHSPTLTPR